MKSRKLQIIIFSILFVISALSMIILLSFLGVNPKIDIVDMRITNVTPVYSSYDSSLYRYDIEITSTIKNENVAQIRSCAFQGEITHLPTNIVLENIISGTRLNAFEEQTITRTIVIYEDDLAQLNLEGEELTIDSLELTSYSIRSITKPEFSSYLYGGLILIPFTITFGGLMFYSIFRKEK